MTTMYGNHPQGTMHKRDIMRNKTMAGPWRTRDGMKHPVTVRYASPKVEVPA